MDRSALLKPHWRLCSPSLVFVQCQHRSSKNHPVMCVSRTNVVHRLPSSRQLAAFSSRESISGVCWSSQSRERCAGGTLCGRDTTIGHEPDARSTGSKYSSPLRPPYCGTCAGLAQTKDPHHHMQARRIRALSKPRMQPLVCVCLYKICHWQNNETPAQFITFIQHEIGEALINDEMRGHRCHPVYS